LQILDGDSGACLALDKHIFPRPGRVPYDSLP
jgi:hypothetical protein